MGFLLEEDASRFRDISTMVFNSVLSSLGYSNRFPGALSHYYPLFPFLNHTVRTSYSFKMELGLNVDDVMNVNAFTQQYTNDRTEMEQLD